MVGQTSDSSDYYVSGGINWEGFTLAQLVAMINDEASVPQLERLALDWRETGDGVVDAAEFLADALDDLMNYWTGESAEKARHVVALNAQWVRDLGTTAGDMGTPIDEAAGALRAAQEAMPRLPATPPAEFPAAAPRAAENMGAFTGSPLGGAVGATAAGSESGFAAAAEQAEAKRIAVETMQRFEAAAVGIDRSTPRFLGQDTVLRPEPTEPELDPGESVWVSKVTKTSGVDLRWQVLTGMTEPSGSTPFAGGGFTSTGGGSFAGGGFGGTSTGVGVGAVGGGPVSGGAPGGVAGVRPDLVMPGRGLPAAVPGAVIGGGPGGVGGVGPMGAAPMGAGAGMGDSAQPHRRRFPFDADDPFDSGGKASPPVIGL
jgi:hypothetical protein